MTRVYLADNPASRRRQCLPAYFTLNEFAAKAARRTYRGLRRGGMPSYLARWVITDLCLATCQLSTKPWLVTL